MKRIDLFLEKLEKELELPIITKIDNNNVHICVHIYAKLKKFNVHLATVRKIQTNWKLVKCYNSVINDIYEEFDT